VNFHLYLDSVRPDIDRALGDWLPDVEKRPRRLHRALRYATFAGGKRVRPALSILVGELFGADRESLLPPAAGLEMIHTFSLIHDDLPALDDDDLRRGVATLHREFDEALAILAGDALLNLGLGLVARQPAAASAEQRLQAVQWLTEAVGTSGMIGGQMEDIEAERRIADDRPCAESDSERLERIHRGKTGALLEVSLRLGGLYALVDSEIDQELAGIGRRLGLMFQIADDILDVEGDTATLGKTAGKDARADKLTYPGVYGLEESKRMLSEIRDRTLERVSLLPGEGGALPSLVSYLADRDR
jgi:geranylgeranyl pyrophosphate synthase